MKLIDLESPEVDAILDHFKYKDGGREYNRGVSDLLFQITHATTVDPVKHGKWVKDENGDSRCSECKIKSSSVLRYSENLIITDARYCPCCGAKMDKI